MIRDIRYMLISKEKQRYCRIDGHKISSGRFFTAKSKWLLPQIIQFIRSSNCDTAVDPFMGSGDILSHIRQIDTVRWVKGFDIHPTGDCRYNDSLLDIPHTDNAIIATNPPYLAKHSAKRKRVWDDISHYFVRSPWNDLYQIALDRCLEKFTHVVAIIPETFLNSKYPKDRLSHVTIVEHDLFEDTDCPICIACFDSEPKQATSVGVYLNDELLGSLKDFDEMRLIPQRNIRIQFNDPKGPIAIRAIDLTDPAKPIRFMLRSDIDYPEHMIKVSSRLVTFVSMPSIQSHELTDLIEAANTELDQFRQRTHDVVLSPFKGNRKDGRRRRRLDYATARAILERAARQLHGSSQGAEPSLFEEDSNANGS